MVSLPPGGSIYPWLILPLGWGQTKPLDHFLEKSCFYCLLSWMHSDISTNWKHPERRCFCFTFPLLEDSISQKWLNLPYSQNIQIFTITFPFNDSGAVRLTVFAVDITEPVLVIVPSRLVSWSSRWMKQEMWNSLFCCSSVAQKTGCRGTAC